MSGYFQCYWCEKQLPKAERTLEHVFPRFMKALFPHHRPPKAFASACGPCNHSRGVIYGLVYDARNRLKWKEYVAKDWQEKDVFGQYDRWRELEQVRLGFSYLDFLNVFCFNDIRNCVTVSA